MSSSPPCKVARTSSTSTVDTVCEMHSVAAANSIPESTPQSERELKVIFEVHDVKVYPSEHDEDHKYLDDDEEEPTYGEANLPFTIIRPVLTLVLCEDEELLGDTDIPEEFGGFYFRASFLPAGNAGPCSSSTDQDWRGLRRCARQRELRGRGGAHNLWSRGPEAP